jgi:hypothetical protein
MLKASAIASNMLANSTYLINNTKWTCANHTLCHVWDYLGKRSKIYLAAWSITNSWCIKRTCSLENLKQLKYDKKKSGGSITVNLEGFHGVTLSDLRVGWKDMVAKQCISTCKLKSIMRYSPGQENKPTLIITARKVKFHNKQIHNALSKLQAHSGVW